MNEFYVNMDSSGDELINSTFNLLEDSQDTVNMASVNVVYSSAYDNSLTDIFSKGQVIYLLYKMRRTF